MSEDADLEQETIRRVSLRLIPFLFILYLFNFLDRTNVALAALQMNRDLRFSSTAFGLGAGIFFVSYAAFEIPSNIILVRVGARRWIARIMISWGIIASAMMLVRMPMHFYVLRFLLGLAEAGFFPGIIYYMTQWFPATQRARATSRFTIAVPLSGVLGGVVGGYLLGLDGKMGLAGWQWLFLLEGLPSVIFGVIALWYLTDKPADAHWLTESQRTWLQNRMQREHEALAATQPVSALSVLKQPIIWMITFPYFLMITAGYGYTFWLPTVLRDTLHTTDTQTGLVTALLAVCSMVVMLIVGTSSDKKHERFYHAAAAVSLVGVGFAGTALISQPFLRVVFLGIVLLGANGMLPAFWSIPSMFLSGSAAAVGIAMISAVGSTGGFIGPYLIGLLKDRTGGNTVAFLTLAAFGFASAVSLILLKRQPVPARESAL